MMKVSRILIAALVVVSSGLTFAQQSPAVASPPVASDSGPEQPLSFSHKLHAGTMSLKCQTCHTPSSSGEAFRIPQAPVCMQCHQSVATDRPAIQKLAGYAQSNTPIPWVRIYELPSFVTFSHNTHLNHGATCEQCHGAVRTRDRLFKEQDLSMKWCVDCHTAKQASTDCNTCHTLEQ
jgi:predicted CXXCH cytochrome family protein